MKYSLRNFILTFVISLIIFGAIAWGVVGSLKNMGEDILAGNVITATDDKSNTPGLTDTSDDDAQDFKGKSFNFLAVGMDTLPKGQNENSTDDEGIASGSMDAIMLVRADKENKKFIFISLPTDFIINFKGENMPLSQLTKRLDITDNEQLQLLLGKITAITGLNIDYYAFIDMENFVQTIDNLGGITYNAPQDMDYEDEEQDLRIKFKRNEKLTTGEDILKLLRYVTYNNSNDESEEFDFEKAKSETTRTSLHMSFANALFEKMLTDENMISVPIWIPDIFKSTITNFGLNAVKDNIDLIFSYKDYTAVNMVYSQGYINHVDHKYSEHEPNKELIKASITRISSEIGKMI